MKTPRKTYIYGLQDSRTDDIFYVGKSDEPETRLACHLSPRSVNRDKRTRIKAIQDSGSSVDLIILAEVLYSDWREAEVYWIAYGHEQGWPLTNKRSGGEGGYAKPDYSFMHDWIPPRFRDKFDALPLSVQDDIIVKTAQAGVSKGWRWPGQYEAMTRTATNMVARYVP